MTLSTLHAAKGLEFPVVVITSYSIHYTKLYELAKIRAAKMVAACGGSSFIGPGKHADILKALFSGELIGTFFMPGQGKINRRKHWIAYVLKPQGFLVVDNGARRALVEKGKSLLPSGITEIRGSFPVGAPVHCLDVDGTVIAAGLSNFSSADLERIKGRKTCVITSYSIHYTKLYDWLRCRVLRVCSRYSIRERSSMSTPMRNNFV